MATVSQTCMPYFVSPFQTFCPNPAATGALTFDIGFRGCNTQSIGRYSSATVTVVGNGQTISCRSFDVLDDGSTSKVICYTSPSALSPGAYAATIQLTLASNLQTVQGDSSSTITVTPCAPPSTTLSVPPTVTTTITTTSKNCDSTLVSHLIQQTAPTDNKRDVVNTALLDPRAVLAMYSVETIYPSGCPTPTTTSTTSSAPTTTTATNSCRPTITLIPHQSNGKRGEAPVSLTNYDTITLYPPGCPSGTLVTTTITSTTTMTTTTTPTLTTTSSTTMVTSSTSPAQCTAQSLTINGRSCMVSCSTDRPGGDYSQSRTGSISACIQACAADVQCMTAQYHEDSGFCYLKNAVNQAVSTSGVDSVDCSVSVFISPTTIKTSTTTSNQSVRPTSVTTTTTTTTPISKSSSKTSLSSTTPSSTWSIWSTYTTKTSSVPTSGWTGFDTSTTAPGGNKSPLESDVTITLTTTYNVPCPTGWITKTVTITTTHCGCTESPVPTVVPMTTYTTTCPPSWGFTTPLVVTVPVYVVAATAQVSQYPASPAPTWSIVTNPAASASQLVENTITVTNSGWTAPTGTTWNKIGSSATPSPQWDSVVVGTYKGGIGKIGVSSFMGALAALAAFII